MLRKFAYNKIFRTLGMMFLFLLLLLFPAYKKYSLDEVIKKASYIKKNQKEIFLLDSNGYISRAHANINALTNREYLYKLMEMLIIDGKYYDNIPNGFRPILPSSLKINELKIENDNVIIDFSDDFYDLKEEDEEKAVELITYNLTLINEIKNVYIKINGNTLDFLPKSKIIINSPLKRSDGVNKIIDMYNYKDTQNVTVYYLNSYNNSYYYVPVTKLTNNKDDKIKVIVEELTSSNIYEPNLVSFINYNTKLLNYEFNDKDLVLNFNEYIFDDAKKETILEEVIYSISLSVKDNYDIENIVFKVNNKEILKSCIKNIE